jgi:hypothetical protein
VALCAQTLERARPELIQITPMRLNVIAHSRHGDDSASQTELAKRLLLQLIAPEVFPSVVLV